MNIYAISLHIKFRGTNKYKEDCLQIVYAYMNKDNAEKKLNELNSVLYAGRKNAYKIHEVPICDFDAFKFAVVAGMSPAEKE